LFGPDLFQTLAAPLFRLVGRGCGWRLGLFPFRIRGNLPFLYLFDIFVYFFGFTDFRAGFRAEWIVFAGGRADSRVNKGAAQGILAIRLGRKPASGARRQAPGPEWRR
jgi:hypothetical protein